MDKKNSGRKKGSLRNKTYEESETLRQYIQLQTELTGGQTLMSEAQVSKVTGISRSTLRDIRKFRTISSQNEKALRAFFDKIIKTIKKQNN